MNRCRKCGRSEYEVQMRRNETWCKECYAEERAMKRMMDKQTVIQHYGGKCECCGETIPEFLTMDHINGNGGQIRQSGRHQGGDKWAQVINEGFPGDLRILCYNCNEGTHINRGICPHKDPCSYPVSAGVSGDVHGQRGRP